MGMSDMYVHYFFLFLYGLDKTFFNFHLADWEMSEEILIISVVSWKGIGRVCVSTPSTGEWVGASESVEFGT